MPPSPRRRTNSYDPSRHSCMRLDLSRPPRLVAELRSVCSEVRFRIILAQEILSKSSVLSQQFHALMYADWIEGNTALRHHRAVSSVDEEGANRDDKIERAELQSFQPRRLPIQADKREQPGDQPEDNQLQYRKIQVERC